MRELLRRLRPTRRTPDLTGPSTGGNQRSSAYLPLLPWQVRGRRFTTRRRGADPDEVAAFLDQVADDLAAVYAALGHSRDETIRIKDALRAWQSRQAPSMRDLARRP